MATTINTSDVVNWAYQYSLASAKLTSAQNKASSSATRSADIATAQASFNSTMKSLVPAAAQTSVQFQYFDAYTNYNTALASATTEAGRQAATDSLLTELSGITMPTPTSSTLSGLVSDTLSAQKTILSNAAASMKSMQASAAKMASNASAAWNAALASGANALQSMSANLSKLMASQADNFNALGSGLSSSTNALLPNTAASPFAASTAASAANGTPGDLLNASLIGYLAASQAANTS